MRQRLLKAICCIALSVSVFFCSHILAMATELDPADEIGFEVDVATTRPALVYPIRSGTLGYAEAVTDSNFTILLKPGYVYNGQIVVRFSLEYTPENITGFNMTWYDINCRSSLTDVGVSYNYFKRNGNVWTFDLYCTFNGLYIESELPITISVTMMSRIHGNIASSSTASVGNIILTPSSDFSSRYWTATLPEDYNIGGVIDTVGQQQMQQQQQIADQQAQQSQQQHQDLVSGYDNAGNDSMLADKGSVLQGFEQQQDQAISSGQQHVVDFSAQYDTAIFATMAPSFALVSTMFNTLWNGMGQFSTVLIIGLVLCVAGYILKLKH